MARDDAAKMRETPYISINKLGEYMVATPARRRAVSIKRHADQHEFLRRGAVVCTGG